MEKLKYIKIEHQDGTLSENVPIGVDANNVDNGNETLTETLSSINNRIATAIASSEPQMVSSTSQMTDQTKMYVLSSSNTIYYYNNGTWTNSNIQYTPSLTAYLGRKNADQIYPTDCNVTGLYYLGSSNPKPESWPSGVTAAHIIHVEGPNNNPHKTWELIIPHTNQQNEAYLYFRNKDYSTAQYKKWIKVGSTKTEWLDLIPKMRLFGIYQDAVDTLGQITTQEEFDNALTGFYFIGSSYPIEGVPANAGLLMCLTAGLEETGGQNTTRTYQIFIPFMSKNDTIRSFYDMQVRNLTVNGWTNWRSVVYTNSSPAPTPTPTEPRNTIVYDSVNGYYDIKFGDAGCKLRHNTGTQWDIWHPLSFSLRGVQFSSDGGQDFTGPIREDRASDFCSGVHGEEIDTKVKIYADGVEITTSDTTAVGFDSLMIYKETNVFSDLDNTQQIATRNLTYLFTDNDLIIHNKFTFTKAVSIKNSCVTGLASVYDDCAYGFWMNGEGVLKSTSQSCPPRTDNTLGRIYLNNGIMELKMLEGKTETTNGFVTWYSTETRPRHKIYFMDSTVHSYNIGDELQGSSEIKFY